MIDYVVVVWWTETEQRSQNNSDHGWFVFVLLGLWPQKSSNLPSILTQNVDAVWGFLKLILGCIFVVSLRDTQNRFWRTNMRLSGSTTESEPANRVEKLISIRFYTSVRISGSLTHARTHPCTLMCTPTPPHTHIQTHTQAHNTHTHTRHTQTQRSLVGLGLGSLSSF